MKLRWLMAACATLMFAGLGSSVVRAQDHAQDEQHRQMDAKNPKFTDHDRQAANDWYTGHKDHPVVGFRAEDRLSSDLDSQLVAGFVLNTDWRKRCHPVPVDLMAELPAPPTGYRYYVVGGHVVLVDSGWRVVDVININL